MKKEKSIINHGGTKMEKQKATLYLSSMMGSEIVRAEGYLVDFKFTDYAQYKNTPQVDFIFKGKRTVRRFIEGFRPFFLILKGWDTPIIPESLYYNIEESEEMVTKTSKRGMCDEENYFVFNEFIEPFLKSHNILFDYRYMKVAEQKEKEMCLTCQ